jgi:hypothetical protein
MKRNTWYWILLSVLSILLISSGLACVAEPGSTPTAQPPPTEQPEKTPAQFQISALTVKPGTVMVGYPATVAATIINRGDIAGTYTAWLLIDGQKIERSDVWVVPGATEEVSFQVTKAAVGSYELMVGDRTAKLTICAWTPQTIEYDSGVFDPQFMGTYTWGETGVIVHFTPPAKPFKIQKVSISAHTKVANFADLHKRMFTVRIWNEHKTQQLWSDEFPWDLFETMGWQDIDVPDIIADGDFHVEVVTNSDAPPSNNLMAISYEESKGEVRSGVSLMGKLGTPGSSAVKDKRWFIRVKGQGPPTTCIPQEYQPKVEEMATVEPEAELITSSATLVYEDDFDDPGSGWTVESTEHSDWYYESGEYHGLVKSGNFSSWWPSPSSEILTDFILETDGKLVSGQPSYGSYGLCFRYQDKDNFYLFLVGGNGYYLIGTRTNGQWVRLADMKKSDSIAGGNNTNHLKVICKGSKIAVYANGHLLTTITDESFSDGRVGVIIDTAKPNAHVAFDNFKVYSPD